MPEGGGGGRAFSGYPAAPSSPRDITNVDNSKIHEHIIYTEDGIAAAWGAEFRRKADKELLAKVTAAAMGRPPPVKPTLNRLGYVVDAKGLPISPRQPSSAAGARVQGSYIASVASPRGSPRGMTPHSMGGQVPHGGDLGATGGFSGYRSTPVDYSVADQVAKFKRGDYPAPWIEGAAHLPRSPRYLDVVDPIESPRPVVGSIGMWRAATPHDNADLRLAKQMNAEVLERLRSTPLHKPLTPRDMNRRVMPFAYGRTLHGLLNPQGTDERAS